MGERKVAIVTGASAGIGQATAVALARRGYAVVVSARRAEKLAEVADACLAAGSEGIVKVADVSDQAQVDELVNSTVSRLGRLDVMVNNAGYGLRARVHETSDEQMRAIFVILAKLSAKLETMAQELAAFRHDNALLRRIIQGLLRGADVTELMEEAAIPNPGGGRKKPKKGG